MKNIAIVYGGYSSEAAVSERSCQGLLTFIDKNKYNLIPVFISRTEWSAVIDGKHFPIDRTDFSFSNGNQKIAIDYAYVTIHGEPGENGQLAGYFEMIGLPHSTCPSATSAITYDKFYCNNFLRGAGIRMAEEVCVRKGDNIDPDSIIKVVGLPCFVKPSGAGSSFGVSKVKAKEDLLPAIEKAYKECDTVLIERLLVGTEVTCGLYKTKEHTVVFPLTEVVSHNEFFDYEAKYTAGVTDEITPARIPNDVRDKVQQSASELYDLLQMHGIVRIDYFICNDGIYPIDINTTPGMTVTSFIPQQIRAAGIPIADVFTDIIEH